MIEKLLAREDLSEQESSEALKALIQGAEAAQMAAFLVLLRAKVCALALITFWAPTNLHDATAWPLHPAA